MADAKKVDPETKRTLPVLTKPDMIDAGAGSSVRELILGEKTEGFQQGLHMVKSRGQAALNRHDTIEQGLLREDQYFAQMKPWCDIENRKLFGIPNLRRKLADLQIDMTREALPIILAEISNKKNETTTELSRLGCSLSTLAEKRSFYNDLCHQVVTVLFACFSGQTTQGHGAPLASPMFHDACSLLRDKLQKGRLYQIGEIMEEAKVVITYKNSQLSGTVMAVQNGLFFFDIDKSDTGHSNPHESAFLKRDAQMNTTNIPVGSVFDHGCHKGYVRSGNGRFDQLIGQTKNDFLTSIKPDRSWLCSMIKKNRPFDAPFLGGDELFRTLVKQFIEEDWYEPCIEMTESIFKILKTTVSEVIEQDKSIASFPKLKRLMRGRADSAIETFIKNAKDDVESFLNQEETSYTQDGALYENLRSRQVDRMMDLASEALGSIGLTGTSTTQASTIKDILKSTFLKRAESVEDCMAEELEEKLGAYGKIAYRRFIDGVPMKCRVGMVHLPEEIRRAFGEVTDLDVENAISLSPSDEERRKHLETKLEILEKGLAILKDLSY